VRAGTCFRWTGRLSADLIATACRFSDLSVPPSAELTMPLSGDAVEAALNHMAANRPSLKRLFYPNLVSEVVGPYMLSRRRHYDDAQWIQLVHGMHTSNTVYVGNLSFYTREEQVHELFSRAGPVKRVIMGLNANQRTPCGFCFVEFETHQAAATAARTLSGFALDDRLLKADLDAAFEEGRQYGRGRAGGQIEDDRRTEYDQARGGWGALQQARQERQQQAEKMRAEQTDTFGGGEDHANTTGSSRREDTNRQPDDPELDPETYGSENQGRDDGSTSIFNIDRPFKLSASTLASIMPGRFPYYGLPLSDQVKQALQKHIEETNPTAAVQLAGLLVPPAATTVASAAAASKRSYEDAPSSAVVSAEAHPVSPSSPASKRPRHTAPSSPQPRSMSPQPMFDVATPAAAAGGVNRSPRPIGRDDDDDHPMSDRDDNGGDVTPQNLSDAEDDDGGDRTPQHAMSDRDDGDVTPRSARSPTPDDGDVTPRSDRTPMAEDEDGDRTPQQLSPHTDPAANTDMADDDATPPPVDRTLPPPPPSPPVVPTPDASASSHHPDSSSSSSSAAASALPKPREPLFVPHLAAPGSSKRLPPWIVHVFQGKPAHQNDEEQIDVAGAEFPGQQPSASAVSLSLPSQTVVSSPTSLPFLAPTSKSDHDSHDLSLLSPEQAAFYANEYGKVEQQIEIAGTLEALRFRDDKGEEQRVCQRVCFHQVSVNSVAKLVRSLQQAQAALDARRSAAADDATRDAIPNLIVLNLCDGTETDGYPGITIARALQATLASPSAETPALSHTGADEAFFDATTDKVTMKGLFVRAGVRTSAFVDLSSIDTTSSSDASPSSLLSSHSSLLQSLAPLSFPLIIKPTSSYSSCGLSSRSVVTSSLSALVQARDMKRELGDVLAEEYVQGREFSMLVVGDAQQADGTASSSSSSSDASYPHLRCYPACERAFSPSLPPLERFLTFEQNYPTKHTKVATWWQQVEEEREQREMAKLACAAYTACHGRSYGRIDIRQSSATGEFFILEVNSLPGLSGELDSSVGAILAHTKEKTQFGEFLYAILHLAAEQRLDQPRTA
jgi:nuclear cap-binding protein subunit 2